MGQQDWTPYRLVPHDVLYFGDGRPSVMGEDHYLRSVFPPFPSTLYGAIRTRRLHDAGVDLVADVDADAWRCLPEDLRKEIGEFSGFGTLELRGPWLEQRGVPVFPAPADLGLVLREDDPTRCTIREVVRYRIPDHPPAGVRNWSHPLELLVPCTRQGDAWVALTRDATLESAGEWYLTTAGMQAWAAGGIPDQAAFVPKSDLWLDEVRTGLGLQKDARLAQEHQIYTYGFIRLREDVTLGFEARGTGLEAGGALRLGGDARTVDLVPGRPLALPPLPAGSGNRTLYFATPSLSEAGAYPPAMDVGTRQGTWGGATMTVLAAALRGSVPCGGYDVRLRRQKPLRRAIPAGTVYICDGVLDSLHGANVCGYANESLAGQGYGLTFVGSYL